MKRVVVGSVFGMLVILLAAGPPEAVTFEDCGGTKGPVAFSHQAHVGAVADCVACHHTNEGLTANSGGEVETCASCHLDPADEATPSCSEMSLKKNPYHANCIGCHKTEGAGPTKCNDCHVKE